VYAVLHELLQGLNDDRVHVGHVAPRVEACVGEVQCCWRQALLKRRFWAVARVPPLLSGPRKSSARAHPRLYLPRGLETKRRVQRRRWRRDRWGGGSPPAGQPVPIGPRQWTTRPLNTAAFHDRACRPVTQPHTDRRIERKRFARTRPRARR
jgi:hypothetical protein